MHHFSQGLEALTLQQNGLDGTTSSIASGKSFRVKSLSTIFPTPNNMKTSKTSTQMSIEDELTFSAEAFHVNPSALQENEKAQRTIATCGRRCLELSESVNRVGSWARTFAGLLIGRTDWYSKRVTLTWKLLGTPSNRLLFQLVPQAVRPTDATEFGLLLTPTTREEVMDMEKFKARMEKYNNGTTVPNLATQIHGMLPTPVVQYGGIAKKEEIEGMNKVKNGKRVQGLNLQDLAINQMLPTPIAQEHDKITGKENQDNLTKRAREMTGKTSQLSPLFVEEMMGFPKNWTALPFQSGEENLSKHTEMP